MAGFACGEPNTIAFAGIRSCLCYEVSDRDGEKPMKEGIDENAEFIRYASGDESDLVAGTFGLHASLTLSDATLEACSTTAPAVAGAYFARDGKLRTKLPMEDTFYRKKK